MNSGTPKLRVLNSFDLDPLPIINLRILDIGMKFRNFNCKVDGCQGAIIETWKKLLKWSKTIDTSVETLTYNIRGRITSIELSFVMGKVYLALAT